MSSVIQEQKDYSCKLVSMLLYRNKECMELLSRLYPHKLFSNIRKGAEIMNPKTGEVKLDWRVDDLERFFHEITTGYHNDALS